MSSGFDIGDWCWHTRQSSSCRVIDRQDVWGATAYRVWLPGKDSVLRARPMTSPSSRPFIRWWSKSCI